MDKGSGSGSATLIIRIRIQKRIDPQHWYKAVPVNIILQGSWEQEQIKNIDFTFLQAVFLLPLIKLFYVCFMFYVLRSTKNQKQNYSVYFNEYNTFYAFPYCLC